MGLVFEIKGKDFINSFLKAASLSASNLPG